MIAQKKGENPEMRISLELHKIAKRDGFRVYGLPYRIYYDYLRKRAKEPSNKLMLNPCYPDPGYPIEGIITVSKDDFEIPNEKMEKGGADLYTYDYLKPEVQEVVYRIMKRFSPWANKENINKAEWKKTFLHLFTGYDFKEFTCFDHFGMSLTEANECYGVIEPQIDIFNDMCQLRQDEYLRNPEKYKHTEPIYREEYSYLFYEEPFALKLTRDEAQGTIDMYANMNMPMSDVEIEAFLKLHGVV